MEYKMDRLVDFVSPTTAKAVHLVDVENLVGIGKLTAPMVAQARRTYISTVNPAPNDLVVVASGVNNAKAVFEGWPRATYRQRKGKDGADLSLVAFFEGIEHPERFTKVFVASGDAALAPVAARAKEHGSNVVVVSRAIACSYAFKNYQVLVFNSQVTNV